MEEIRICAFFDALGTKEIMMGANLERRYALIKLIRHLKERDSLYSPNIESLGSALITRPSAQVTSFSDNVAISFPLTTYKIPTMVGTQPFTFEVTPNQFFNHLLIQTISAVWDGLKIGVLFRGGITVGRLVHNEKIIVGEALIKAFELEKNTIFPRIEIDEEVLGMKDDKGQYIVDDQMRQSLECIENRWYVKTLDLHMGYWRDHNWYRQQEGKEAEEINVVLSQIKDVLQQEFQETINSKQEDVIEKWQWFIEHYNTALQSGNWKYIDNACKEIIHR